MSYRRDPRALAMNRAHAAVALALRTGALARPEACEQCRKRCKPDAAHYDYGQPLNVRWLCRSCHVRWDCAIDKPSPEIVAPRLLEFIDSPLTRALDEQGRFRNWMAEQLGVTPWTFSKVESGTIRVPPGWYERAAAILGVSVAEITPQEPVAAA